MNNLHYLLLLFITLFIVLSLVVTPKSFDEYFESDIDTTIPEEIVRQNIPEGQETTFDIEAFFSALDNQDIESNHSIEINSGWTIEVKEYNDKEALMNDFRMLKDLGLKAYIQYKNDKANTFILYVGPTMDRDDSRDNLQKISELTKFTPKIISYD